jgi:hypothetical protein
VRLGTLLLIALAAFPPVPADPVPYFIVDGKGVPGFNASDRELAGWAFDAWARESGGKLKFVETKVESDARIRLQWVSAREGLYGEMRRVGTVATVYIIPEVALQKDRLMRDAILYLTCVHELGHAIGLPHTSDFKDIMYSFGYGGDIDAYFMRYRTNLKSRADIAKFSGLSAADITALRRQ